MSAVQQKGDSRGRILAAARHLFGARGFHQTAMSELATEAQISVGQIYRSFKNKNEIIAAIVSDDIDEFLTDLDTVLRRVKSAEISAFEAFEQLVRDNLCANDTGLTFEILAEAHRNPPVAEKIASVLTPCRATLRALACEANKTLTGRDLEAVEELLLACLFGLGHRPPSGRDLNIEGKVSDIARMMLKALQN